MWWSDQVTAFHFDKGRDLEYAKNIDKGGHFFGGVLVADVTQWSLKWSGVKEKNAYWYGVGMGTLIQLSIEIKDAYAPYWGFSLHDFGIGTIGSFLPITKRYCKAMKYFDFKYSYYKRTNKYWELGAQQRPDSPPKWYAWQDDYINQTYWLTVYPLKNLGVYLGLSLGIGLDDSQYIDESFTKRGGRNEFYIALDYDLKSLLKNWNTPLAKRIKHTLNYFKFPAPAIKISPSVKFYPIFF